MRQASRSNVAWRSWTASSSERKVAIEPRYPIKLVVWSVTGRQRSIAFFIALGAGAISVVILLYVGWVLLNWRTGILLFLGVLLLLADHRGVVLNTIFLVREIRRNEQHDAFINAVTHELKTPVASIRLYLETLQTRAVDETKRQGVLPHHAGGQRPAAVDHRAGSAHRPRRAVSRKAERCARSIWTP